MNAQFVEFDTCSVFSGFGGSEEYGGAIGTKGSVVVSLNGVYIHDTGGGNVIVTQTPAAQLSISDSRFCSHGGKNDIIVAS